MIGYRGILQNDMDINTRETIKHLDFLFEPHNAAISLVRNVRDGFFAMVGRLVFNLITDPSGTIDEIGQVSH